MGVTREITLWARRSRWRGARPRRAAENGAPRLARRMLYPESIRGRRAGRRPRFSIATGRRIADMTSKMMLAALLALSAVPALAADTTSDRAAAAAAPSSAQVTQVVKEVPAQKHAQMCTCGHHG
jgi:hypothetical protein